MLLGVIDFRQQRHLAEEEFIKRGEAMAANLAQGSKLAVFTENEFLLNSAMKSVTGDADFAYVLIYGEDWKILALKVRRPFIGLISDFRFRIVDSKLQFLKTKLLLIASNQHLRIHSLIF